VLFLIGILLCCGCASQASTETGLMCTISINCETALDKTTMINADLLDMLPQDGWILEPVQIAFKEGDSVFDVFMHTVREYNIHMEYVDTPIYDSAYIEGINNLYEFDAGAHSGWMYRVNGDFPNYGCSGYSVADGDIIVMCSDGLVETKNEVRKDWLETFLKNVSTNNVQKLADLILAESIDNNMGVVQDDITVIVSKVVKKNK
jgi:hypothetical protein